MRIGILNNAFETKIRNTNAHKQKPSFITFLNLHLSAAIKYTLTY